MGAAAAAAVLERHGPRRLRVRQLLHAAWWISGGRGLPVLEVRTRTHSAAGHHVAIGGRQALRYSPCCSSCYFAAIVSVVAASTFLRMSLAPQRCLCSSTFSPKHNKTQTTASLCWHAPRCSRSILCSPAPSAFLCRFSGGGLTAGSGNFEPLAPFAAHAGSSLEGVIVVSINYRLGMLGFLATAEISASAGNGVPGANFGLLDQQAALQWVQQNIASFGGDPTRVTIAGQSSGGTSIFGLYSSPASKGLFTGAIALSGSINTSMSLLQGQVQNAGVPASLGCANEGSPEATVACMRALPASKVVAAMPPCWDTPGMWGLESLKPGGMDYCGLILIDGLSVTMGFGDALAAGLIDVPLIIGNMGQENDLAPDVDVSTYSKQAWGSYLESCLAPWHNASMAQSVLALYDPEGQTPPERAMCDLNTDYGLSCGTVSLALGAKSQGGAFQSPLYVFVNQWAPSTPIPSGLRTLRYAFHTWDYSVAIENWSGLSGLSGWAPGVTDLALSTMLQSLWYTFIQTGSLAGAQGAAGVEWASFEATAGFPANYNTFVFSATGAGSGMQTNYKVEQCAMLSEFGLTQPGFWWCD